MKRFGNPDGSNLYSRQWFEFFHAGIDEARTIREMEFICSCAPLPGFRKVLDVCCGTGRHTRALSNRGYAVTGVDRDANAIAKARAIGDGPNYIVADIRSYRSEPGVFDMTIVIGQSFGHFDAAINRDVLRSLGAGVRERGRVVLDLWNPDFFAAHQGERELETIHGLVHENKRVEGDRLFVQLHYPDRSREQFEWQMFTPAKMEELAQSLRLTLLRSCSGFDKTMVPSPIEPRIQFVLER